LAYLDLHEEALILTIDQAMMRSSSCLIISLWTKGYQASVALVGAHNHVEYMDVSRLPSAPT
jgi:hypothetical protein